jgi:NTP pyrophosphatase (non-canonical NTP hydrolase)
MSSLKHLYILQEGLMKRLGVEYEGGVDIYSDHFIAACIGMVVEAGEVLDEINVATRPWAEKPVKEARQAVAREAIDVFFYFLEIMIMMGIDPLHLVELYEDKWDINMQRASGKSGSS